MFFNYTGDKYGVQGSRFGRLFGSSRNHPKSIAIDPEVKISHLGITKTPNNFLKYINKPRKTEQTPNGLPYFGLTKALFFLYANHRRRLWKPHGELFIFPMLGKYNKKRNRRKAILLNGICR